ncbi:gas vesicle protein [Actinopolymorpha sp. NPDC004070]|uniref:gas vesicle protein n=1 Tax=Actinopolymorpha sp. NPDC004070 TaxID=3154548 RepID=UPI0033AD7EFB
MTQSITSRNPRPDTLADVLERVLDKGVVIAGDIVVNILDIELLSLKLRLFVASAQTAQEMGMDWWTRDEFFTSQSNGGGGKNDQVEGKRAPAELEAENDQLKQRIERLERAIADRELPEQSEQSNGSGRQAQQEEDR